jgi:hypothetical protein
VGLGEEAFRSWHDNHGATERLREFSKRGLCTSGPKLGARKKNGFNLVLQESKSQIDGGCKGVWVAGMW